MLLDTCTWLWLVSDQSKLSQAAKDSITENAGSLFVSSISAFEIAAKHRKGALSLPMPPDEWIERSMRQHGIQEIPVTARIAVRACALPSIHNDPCDRIILATCETEGMSVLTPDGRIKAYPGASVIW